MAQEPQDNREKHGTTGHSWDGIEELNTPMPRWWLWTFYLTVIWGIGYTIFFPAWPLISDATKGVLGYSSRAAVETHIAEVDAMNAPLNAKIEGMELSAIAGDPEVGSYAVNGGKAIFRTYCVQCHQENGGGITGYPALGDDDWLWGGTIEDIHTTITYGIRFEANPDTRLSDMPAFGEFLSSEEIASIADHVLSLSGSGSGSEDGAALFADNCAACHGDEGTGDIFMGAPNLADALWLYGGDRETIVASITNSRSGVMPAWEHQLSEAQIRQLAVYVHELGGGE